MRILAVDPGPTQSAWLRCDFSDHRTVRLRGDIEQNDSVRDIVREMDCSVCVCEMVACYGMPVGAEVFETCFWIGRFAEAFGDMYKFQRIFRQDVKLHLCNSARAKDSNIRQALIDRFGAVGTKKAQGQLYGVKSHLWSALAVAVTYWDKEVAK